MSLLLRDELMSQYAQVIAAGGGIIVIRDAADSVDGFMDCPRVIVPFIPWNDNDLKAIKTAIGDALKAAQSDRWVTRGVMRDLKQFGFANSYPNEAVKPAKVLKLTAAEQAAADADRLKAAAAEQAAEQAAAAAAALKFARDKAVSGIPARRRSFALDALDIALTVSAAADAAAAAADALEQAMYAYDAAAAASDAAATDAADMVADCETFGINMGALVITYHTARDAYAVEIAAEQAAARASKLALASGVLAHENSTAPQDAAAHVAAINA